MTELATIAIGFILTSVVGGWWAARLQQRSWDRQNDLRLQEDERERAAGVSQDLAALLDKRLYRMRRVYWAVDGHQTGSVTMEALDARLSDYNDVLYEWNDKLNANLALLGSYFGPAARTYLYDLYERFRVIGAKLEEAARTARSGGDVLSLLRALDSEFEGWKQGSLNQRIYDLSLAMMSQLREGLVGRNAPEKLPVPTLDVEVG